jgi:tetratricopeptide (TPR) repeat protein
MIVKDEAGLICRCLDSVRPLIDYVLVQDTGSTDDTQDIIRCWLKRHGVLGKVVEEPWRDFGHNRSLALAELRQRNGIDYALIIDADDAIVYDPGFDPDTFKAGLTADLYHIAIRHGPLYHRRAQLCSNRLAFHFRGVIHEFIEGPPGYSTGTVTGFYIQASTEGARSADPDKYHKDAAILEQALYTEDDPFLRSRYTFYLANSWKDGGQYQRALDSYVRRAEMGGWDQEVFMSLYYAGRMRERLHAEHVIETYLRAWEVCPRRAESLHAASCYCRAIGQHHIGFMLARQGRTIVEPADGLFIEPWVYRYGLLDEYAVHAYWSGRYSECLVACEQLLREGRIPDTGRVVANAQFARERLEAR